MSVAWQVDEDGREWCVVCRRERLDHSDTETNQCWGQVLRGKRPVRAAPSDTGSGK